MTRRYLDFQSLEFNFETDRKRLEFLSREWNLYRWFSVPQLRALFKVKHEIVGILSDIETQGNKLWLKLKIKWDGENASYRLVDSLEANIPADALALIEWNAKRKTIAEKLEVVTRVSEILTRASIIVAGSITPQERIIRGEKYTDDVFINWAIELIKSAVAGLLIEVSWPVRDAWDEVTVWDEEGEETSEEEEAVEGQEASDTLDPSDTEKGHTEDAWEEQKDKILSLSDFPNLKLYEIYQIMMGVESIKVTDLAGSNTIWIWESTLKQYLSLVNTVLKAQKISFRLAVRSKDDGDIVIKKYPNTKLKKGKKLVADPPQAQKEPDGWPLQVTDFNPAEIEKLKKDNPDIYIDEINTSVNGVKLFAKEFLFFLFILTQRGRNLKILDVLIALGNTNLSSKTQGEARVEIWTLIKSVNAKIWKKNEYLHIKIISSEVTIAPLIVEENTIQIGTETLLFSVKKWYIKWKGNFLLISSEQRVYLIEILEQRKLNIAYKESDEKCIEGINTYFVTHSISLKLVRESHRIFLQKREKVVYDTSLVTSKKAEVVSALTHDALWEITVDETSCTIFFNTNTTSQVTLSPVDFTLYLVFLTFLKTSVSVEDISNILWFETFDPNFELFFEEAVEILNLKLPGNYKIRTREGYPKVYYVDFDEKEMAPDTIEIYEFENMEIWVNLTQKNISIKGKIKSTISRELYAYIARFCRNKKAQLLLEFKGHPDDQVNTINKECLALQLPFKMRADKAKWKIVLEMNLQN